MAAQQLTIGDRFTIAKKKVTDKVKSALVNDVPPSLQLKQANQKPPTVQQMREFSDRFNLCDLLPYEAFDLETGLWYNRDTVGFMLKCSPATGLSPQELAVLNGILNQSHEADTTIQISLICDTNIEPLLDKWRNTKNNVSNPELKEIFSILANNRVDYLQSSKWQSLFSDEAFLLKNMQLIISYVVPVPIGMNPVDLNEEEVQRLVRTRDAAIGTLTSAHIPAQSMGRDDFINLMHGILNPKKDRHHKLDYDPNKLVSRQVCDADTMLLFDSGCSSLIHNEEAFSVIPYHVKQFPKRWAGFKNSDLIGSFSNNILRVPCPFILTLTIVAKDQVSAKGLVKRKTTRATQMADSPVAKYATQWKHRKVDWQFTEKKVDEGNKLMEANYQILLFAPEGREQECEQALISTYESIGWLLSKSRYTPKHSILSALPMGACVETVDGLRKFGLLSTRLSWTCTNVAPWIGEWKGTETPMSLLSGRRGQITFFDNFDNKKGNFNISCCAAPGSGKSFNANELIYSVMGTGGRTFVIDAGHSYRNLCLLMKGSYIDFGGDIIQKVNPFSNIDPDDPKFLEEQLPLLKELIAQMAAPNRELSQKQRAVLEKAIMRAWNSKKNKASITTVAEELISDNTDDSGLHQTAKDLAIMLHSFTKDGMYASYFEGDATIDLNNPFVVLDLDALNKSPDLQSVILLILMMRITQVMYLEGNRTMRKLCIIDEAWRLLGSGSAGKFIEEGYRVARKHGGSFMTITQKVSDYFQSETAKAAFMNSDFVIYLRQKPEELTMAENLGHIDNSDGKVDLLRTLQTVQGKYSEMAISSPDGFSIMRFTVDQITEKLYSTKAEEVDYLEQSKKNGVDLMTAIKELIAKGNKR